MRTLVLILMIALLPMRMWAAEGMAVRMAQQQLAASDMSGLDSTEGMADDCPMMAKAKAERSSQDQDASTAHCMSCQLCAATACVPPIPFGQGPAPAGPHASRTDSYLSAYVALDPRPPNS
jgi:hypothetical protein